MNLTGMQERLRVELLRRIQRGTVSVSLLARQTGLTQAHVSNFLRLRRRISLQAMDRILSAQHLAAADLLPPMPQDGAASPALEGCTAPLVSHATALFEPFVRPAATQSLLHIPGELLKELRPRTTQARHAWQRFVAVRISAADALAMEPVILRNALVLLDRQYTSLAPYRPYRPNLYAVHVDGRLTIRYVDFAANRLVLRPHNLAFPVELIEIAPGDSPGDLIAGRLALILNEP